MSTATPVPTVPKVRTFATDLNEARTLRGTPAATKSATAVVAPAMSVPVAPPTPQPQTRATAPKPPQPPAVVPKAKEIARVIPPFHTFEKAPLETTSSAFSAKIDTTQFEKNIPLVKPSVLANPGIEPLTVDTKTNAADIGTVITDTKRTGVPFTTAIIQSLQSWWQQTLKITAKKKPPVYSVPDESRRKGVIQKAVSQTGRAGTSDHSEALGRIRAAQKITRGGAVTQTATTPVLTIKNEPVVLPYQELESIKVPGQAPMFVVPAPVVSPVTATGWDSASTITDNPTAAATPIIMELLPAEKIEPVIPVVTPKILPRITPIVPTQTPAAQSALSPISEPKIPRAGIEKNITPTFPMTKEPAKVSEVKLPTPQNRPRIIPTIPAIETADAILSTTETPPSTDETPVSESTPVEAVKLNPHWSQGLGEQTITLRPEPRFAPPRAAVPYWKQILRQPNYVTLGIGGLVMVSVSLWFGYSLITKPTIVATIATPVIPATFFTSSDLTPVLTVSSKAELFYVLMASSSSDASLTEIPVRSSTTGQLLSASEFFSLIDAPTGANFSLSLNQLVFGNYRGQPWLAFSATDEKTAQGGMLSWENTLSQGLAPWFGPAVAQSQKKGLTLFHDAVVRGIDVRVLTDREGKERITYGFVTPTRLVITTDTTAFLNLAEK